MPVKAINSRITVEATFTVGEQELRALKEISAYSAEELATALSQVMGRSLTDQHLEGFIQFLKDVRYAVGPVLDEIWQVQQVIKSMEKERRETELNAREILANSKGKKCKDDKALGG